MLFLWLTLNVDLIIFAEVLLAICLRRVAAALVIVRMVCVEDVLGDRTLIEAVPFEDPTP